MLDPEKIAELDQAVTHMGEVMPAMLWNLYKGCLKEGFDKDQAMRIVIAFLSKPPLPPE